MTMTSRKRRFPRKLRVVDKNFPIQRKKVAKAAKMFFMDVWDAKGKRILCLIVSRCSK